MRPARLQGAARDLALAQFAEAGWSHDPERDSVSKTFRFRDFSEAFGWMTRAALVAEKIDHHPEWRNVWNRVEVVLTTHDPKGLTELDQRLAQAMDALAARQARGDGQPAAPPR